MTPLRQLWEVARRDFVQRAKSKAFLLMTLLTAGLVVSLAPLLALELRDPPPSEVGVVGAIVPTFGATVRQVAATAGIDVDVTSYPDVAALEGAVADGTLDVAVVGSEELVWSERVDQRLKVVVTAAVQEVERADMAEQLGLDPAEVAALIVPAAPTDRVLEPPPEDELPRVIGAQVGVFVLYMSIIIFGQFVLMGVMEEKQSRVVEVVLSRIEPNRLLAGKILGIGLLGIIQIIVLGAAVIFAASLIDIEGVELPSLSMGILASVLFWYLLGYALYATIYGAMGATVSRQEDAQGAVMIPTMLVLPGFFIAMISLSDPESTIALVGSLVPISAPMVMPVRMAFQVASWWEVALAVVLLLATVVLLINLAARVYRGAILSIGAKVRLRDAWRSARA